MAWHLNLSESIRIVVFPVEIRRTAPWIHGISKLPRAVQGLIQRTFLLIQFLPASVNLMITVCRKLAHTKYLRIVQPLNIWLHNAPPLLSFCCRNNCLFFRHSNLCGAQQIRIPEYHILYPVQLRLPAHAAPHFLIIHKPLFQFRCQFPANQLDYRLQMTLV